jgi:poly-beta-hydroxyalkanoate depolymerase
VSLGPAPAAAAADAGHFDILIGKKVDTEVFPLIQQFLEQHDMPLSRL